MNMDHLRVTGNGVGRSPYFRREAWFRIKLAGGIRRFGTGESFQSVAFIPCQPENQLVVPVIAFR